MIMLARHLSRCRCRCGLAWPTTQPRRFSSRNDPKTQTSKNDTPKSIPKTQASKGGPKSVPKTQTPKDGKAPTQDGKALNNGKTPPQDGKALTDLKAHLAQLQLPNPPPHRRIPSSAGPPPSELTRIKRDLARLFSQDDLVDKEPEAPTWPSPTPSTPKWTTTTLTRDFAKVSPEEAAVQPDTLLLLVGLSPALVASDILRIGQQGVHIGGWASGLRDVMQRLEPRTLIPLGEFILHFTTPEAATHWTSDASARRRLASHLLSNPSAATAQYPESDLAAARGFSLACPAEYGHFAPLSGAHRGSVVLAYMRATALRRLLREELHSDAMVVIGLEGEVTQPGKHCDTVPVAMTSDFLRQIVQDDAKEFGYEWSIVRARQWVGSSSSSGGPAAKSPKTPKASRFIMSFGSNGDAHRFVRWWHRREMVLAAPYSCPVTFDVHYIGRML